jgi:hypothetical protein
MLQGHQIANLAFGNGYLGIFTIIPLLCSLFLLTSAFQAWHNCSLSLSVRHTLITFATGHNHVYDHRRPCKSDSIATNLTRLFFPAKNSCDQTSDLEIVKGGKTHRSVPFVRQRITHSQTHIILKLSSISITSEQSMTEDFCSA